MGCFAVAGGCGGDDSAPADGGLTGDDSGACSNTVVVKGCKRVAQNGVEFDLNCSSIVNTPINGHAVCAGSGQCVGTTTSCLDPMNVYSCLPPCGKQDGGGGGGDSGGGGSSPLGATCSSNTECTGGLTCLKSSDNLAPGAGPPNGLCTADCTAQANQTLCKSFGGICVSFSAATNKSYCMEPCTEGKATPADSKCHGRLDTVCGALDSPGLFACVPLCATDADCGTRKCDLGTGLCTDVVTPGAPIGSPCTVDRDCAGAICYPFEVSPDASSTAGVCSALCRLGNIEGCKFRTSALDAGPPVGACLLSTSTADVGDTGICAQLCDSVNDCGTTDSRWTCVFDPDVRTAFGHAGYCWLNSRPDAGTRDAATPDIAPETGAPETGVPETGAPETSGPETGVPEASSPEAGEAASDTPPPDGNPGDVAPPDSAAD
jgi:hypothetical protein